MAVILIQSKIHRKAAEVAKERKRQMHFWVEAKRRAAESGEEDAEDFLFLIPLPLCGANKVKAFRGNDIT